MSKKYITVGLLAGLTAGTGAGLILSQTGSAGAASSAVVVQQDDDTTDTTETEATETDEVRPRRAERLQEVLAPLVEAGTITQAQADAVVAALEEAGPIGRGPGGPGGHGHGRHHRGAKLETVATTLGITVEELRTQLRSGMSIAEVAGDQTQAVIDALVAEATERIEQGVTDGRLTREEADEKLAGLTEKITEMVNTVRPARGEAPADEPVVEDTGS